MYHGIREDARTGHPYYETNTSRRVFALQMKYLREYGYQALDLETATRSLQQGGRLEKSVVITFDDGYRDFYTIAYPILKENKLSATVFLVARFTTDQGTRVNGKQFMTWSQVRELNSGGIRFGSHTLNHPQLKFLTAPEVDEEVGRSKRTIEDKIGSPVRSFSYPFAFPETERAFISNLKNTLQRHGYKNGVSTIIGTAGSNDDRFFLPRLPVNSFDDLRFFRAKLEGGYDWLHFPQQLYKRLKPNLPRIRGIGRHRDVAEHPGP
jgi:peptidoglycan/xylan/chitin deacetylase (PgdA/CDA1 family)